MEIDPKNRTESSKEKKMLVGTEDISNKNDGEFGFRAAGDIATEAAEFLDMAGAAARV